MTTKMIEKNNSNNDNKMMMMMIMHVIREIINTD